MRLRMSGMSLLSMAGCALLFATCTPAMGQTADQIGEKPISRLYLNNAKFDDAIKALAQQTGLQFLTAGGKEEFHRVTLKLDNVTAEDALKYVCDAGGAFYHRNEDGVFIISHKPLDSDTTATPVVPIETKLVIKKITLLHADPKIVYEELLNRTPFNDSKNVFDFRMFDGLSNFSTRYTGVNNTPTQSPTTQIIPQGTNYVNQAMTHTESGNDVQLPGDSANQLGGGGLGGGGGGFGGGGGGLGGGGGAGGGLGGGGGAGGGQQAPQLQGGQGFVPASIKNITYDPTDNSIIVQGTDEDIEKLRQTIQQFDTVPKQVLIKVEFITTSSSLTKDLGFDWTYSRGAVSAGNVPGSFANSADPVFLNYATGNITTRLRTQLLEGEGKTIQAPILRTMNNQPASINFLDVQYIETIQSIVSNGTVITQDNPQALPLRTGLSVAPRVNRDGTITLFLFPQITQTGQIQRLSNGSTVPEQLTEQVQAVARVRNGETIVIGGLTKKTDTGNVSRIPVLSDLPIIGQFFKSTTKVMNDSELLIFVTPTVVDDSSDNQGI